MGRIYGRQRDPPGQRSVYVPPGDNTERELHRLTTFYNFPMNIPIDHLALARNGFYYVGYYDRVKCFSCGSSVEGWLSLEIPYDYGRLHHGHCKMKLGIEPRNKPLNLFFQEINVTTESTPPSRSRSNSGCFPISAGINDQDNAHQRVFTENFRDCSRAQYDDASFSREQSPSTSHGQEMNFTESTNNGGNNNHVTVEGDFNTVTVRGSNNILTIQGNNNNELVMGSPPLTAQQSAQIAQQLAQIVQQQAQIAQQPAQIVQQPAQIVQQSAQIVQKPARIAQQSQIAQQSTPILQESIRPTPQQTRYQQQSAQVVEQPITQELNREEQHLGRCVQNPVNAQQFSPSIHLEIEAGEDATPASITSDIEETEVELLLRTQILDLQKEMDRLNTLLNETARPNVPVTENESMVPGCSKAFEASESSPTKAANLKLQFPCASPVTPGMRNIEDRMHTFDQKWPRQKINATPQQFARAGLFYLGERDRVKCWYCNGGLQNWEPNEDPMTQHTKWFPRCEYVLQRKGAEFVNEVVAKYPNLKRPTLSNPTNNFDVQCPISNPACTTSNFQRGFLQYAELMDFNRTVMTNEAVPRLLQNESRNFDTLIGIPELTPQAVEIDEKTPEELQKLLQMRYLCELCRHNDADALIIPCGHSCLCCSCGAKAEVCPECKCKIDKAVKCIMH